MSNEVKRYDPINSDGTCGMCIEDADYGAYVEYADYAALEAELERVKGEYEWVASINTALDESNQSAWAELAKLRAELELQVPDGWKLVPVERITIALESVQNAMEDAYNNAYQECCGRGQGQCCGDPVAAWSDADTAIMDALAPAQRELSALLAAAPSAPATVQGGVYSSDPLACSGCVSGCFRCRSVKVQGDGWIPVSERLPESERTVLAFYLNSHGKGRRVRAEYIAAKTKSADDGWDSYEPADYDEQADEYFWPAGWYEIMDNWDDLTHMVIHEGEVTHWMSLPAAPAIAAARQEGGKV